MINLYFWDWTWNLNRTIIFLYLINLDHCAVASLLFPVKTFFDQVRPPKEKDARGRSNFKTFESWSWIQVGETEIRMSHFQAIFSQSAINIQVKLSNKNAWQFKRWFGTILRFSVTKIEKRQRKATEKNWWVITMPSGGDEMHFWQSDCFVVLPEKRISEKLVFFGIKT